MMMKKVPSMPQEKGDSMMQKTATMSGSRPTMGKTELMSSAPMDAKTLGRDPGGSLK